MLVSACDSFCNQCTTEGPSKCDTGHCFPDYFIVQSDQTCAPCANQCYDCTVNGGRKCDDGRCHQKYAIDASTRTCVACATNCYLCADRGPGKCDDGRCFPRFGIDKNTHTCQQCDDHCYGCAVNGARTCDQCYERYVFNNDTRTCDECDPRCYECHNAGPGKCDVGRCFERYGLAEDSQTCGACDSHCKDCTNEGRGKCDNGQCFARYGDSGRHTCAECDLHCDSCIINGAGRCDDGHCFEGYGYSSNIPNCVACPEYCVWCNVIGVRTVCQQCDAQHGLSTDGKCDDCADTCSSCAVSGAHKCDPGKCILPSVYDPKTRTCGACSAHCASCTNNGPEKCDEGNCLDGYVYDTSIHVCVEHHCKMCGKTAEFRNTLNRLGLVAFAPFDSTNCTERGDTSRTIGCNGYCWVFRKEKDSQVSFLRGCFKSTGCDKYKYQTCTFQTSRKTMVCYKCCSGESCNTYIPGVNVTVTGSDVSTLSSSGVLTTFLVLTAVATASLYG